MKPLRVIGALTGILWGASPAVAGDLLSGLGSAMDQAATTAINAKLPAGQQVDMSHFMLFTKTVGQKKDKPGYQATFSTNTGQLWRAVGQFRPQPGQITATKTRLTRVR